MFISRLFFALTLIVAFGLIGCHATVPQTQPATSSIDQPARKVVESPRQDQERSDLTITDAAPAPGTARALAQRAANYAQSVEPLAPRRQLASSAKSAEFPDPDSLHLTASEPPVQSPQPLPIRPPAPVSSPQPKTQPPASKAQPQTASAQANSDAFATALAKRATDFPQELSAQTDDQLLKLLKDQPVPDVQSLAGLVPEDRELLSALMDSLTNFRNQLRQNNNMLFSQKIAPLLDLSERLRAQAELTVPTFVICTKAPNFGAYEKVDPARFVAAQSHNIGIYYEVENFSSQLSAAGMYETKLSEQLVLYMESSGMPVWSDQKQTYFDQSHRRRRDFFIARAITLPKTLTMGRYLLKVTVEDQQARRIAENTVPIEIVAQ